jgi:tricorn protease
MAQRCLPLAQAKLQLFQGTTFYGANKWWHERGNSLSTGGFCSFSPDGSKIAFNRVFREFRTWKYYKGGMADDIWIFDYNSKEVINITSNPSQDIIPMWIGDEIFFLSDRDRTMNLFVYNVKAKTVEKVTNYTDYDIKFPSLDQKTIVFEKGGYLYAFDVKTRTTHKINVTIADDQIYSRSAMVDASKRITNAHPSPNGDRVVFSARAISSPSHRKSNHFNLTTTSMPRTRSLMVARWKWIAYLSDKTESTKSIFNHTLKFPCHSANIVHKQLHYAIEWSPDSKKILLATV